MQHAGAGPGHVHVLCQELRRHTCSTELGLSEGVDTSMNSQEERAQGVTLGGTGKVFNAFTEHKSAKICCP